MIGEKRLVALLGCLAAMLVAPAVATAAPVKAPAGSYVLGAHGKLAPLTARNLWAKPHAKRRHLSTKALRRLAMQTARRKYPHAKVRAQAAISDGGPNYLLHSSTGCWIMLAKAADLNAFIAGLHGITGQPTTFDYGDCPDYPRAGGEDDIGYTANATETTTAWVRCGWAIAIVGTETGLEFGAYTVHIGYCTTGQTQPIVSQYGNPWSALAMIGKWPDNDVRDAIQDGPFVDFRMPAKAAAKPRYRQRTERRRCNAAGRLVGQSRAERKVFAKLRPAPGKGCGGTVTIATPVLNAHVANNGGGGYGAVICGVNGQPASNRSGRKVWVRGSFACNAAFEGFTLTTYCRYQAKSTTKKTINSPKTAGTYQVMFKKVLGDRGTRLVSETAVFSFTNIGNIRVNTTQSRI